MEKKKSGGKIGSVCVYVHQGVGFRKCQELPSSTREESFPRVIQHLSWAKRVSTRNSSQREFPGDGVAAPHMLLRGGRGRGLGGGRGLAEPTRSRCPRCSELGRLQSLRERARPSDHPPPRLTEAPYTHGARASPGLDLDTCFSLR